MCDAAMEGETTLMSRSPPCANQPSAGQWCPKQGEKTCSKCKLVAYCGISCQKSHWPFHKMHCKCSLAKAHWRPAWDREGREPVWTHPDASARWHNPFGGEKYLWGNTPAIDILNLNKNEGLHDGRDISLLFAASGDLRHIVQTVANLPEDKHRHVRITVNDREIAVVARILVLLLLALDVRHSAEDQAGGPVEMIIHIWIRPLIEEVRDMLEHRPGETIEKVWSFSNGKSIRLALKTDQWAKILSIFELSKSLTRETASQQRCAVTLAPSRRDFRDRWHFKMHCPFVRVARERFREDGVLVPFGHSRLKFENPNPTLFQDSGEWPLSDQADPLSGWSISDVQNVSWSAANDCYGKLYCFLERLIQRFLLRLEQNDITFSLFSVEMQELPRHLGQFTFDRIEVSNVCDRGYLGIRKTLQLLSCYLKKPVDNPHATLITLFINATKEQQKIMGRDEEPNVERLLNFLPTPPLNHLLNCTSPEMTRIWDARDMVVDVDYYFERYMISNNFKQAGLDFHVCVKADNTVVENWPTRSAYQTALPGSKDAFLLLLGSEYTTLERYVEWKWSIVNPHFLTQ